MVREPLTADVARKALLDRIGRSAVKIAGIALVGWTTLLLDGRGLALALTTVVAVHIYAIARDHRAIMRRIRRGGVPLRGRARRQ